MEKKTEGTPSVFLFIFLLVQIISLLKSVNPSAGINQFLFASKERMALGADFNLDLALGRTGFKSITASTLYYASIVIRMNSFSHSIHLVFDNLSLLP